MFKRKRSVDDFAEEIKAHLELEANELEREGLSEEEARRRAKVEFGNPQAAQERFYLRSRVEWIDNLVRDIRFAFRQLLKNPGFSSAAFAPPELLPAGRSPQQPAPDRSPAAITPRYSVGRAQSRSVKRKPRAATRCNRPAQT